MAGGIRPAKLKSRAYMYIHNFCYRPYLVGEGGGGVVCREIPRGFPSLDKVIIKF